MWKTPTEICLIGESVQTRTLLEPGWSWGNFLIWINRRLRGKCVKLLSADHIHLLEVFYFLLHFKRSQMKIKIHD